MCWGQWQRGMVSLPFRRGSGPAAESSYFPGNTITTPHTTSHHITPHHTISHHTTSHHITLHHITPHHITSYNITSHHITLHLALRYHLFCTRYSKGGDSIVYTHTHTYIHAHVIPQIADLCQPPGVGDKKILRTLAFNLGLIKTSSVVKRAIQFGTRVAKHTNVMYHGSNRKGKGDTRI